MRDFCRTITSEPFKGRDGRQQIEFATNDAAGSHLNIYFKSMAKSDFSRPTSNVCISPDDAKKVRDALIEAYPLPKPAVGGKPATPVYNKANGKTTIEINQPKGSDAWSDPVVYAKKILLRRGVNFVDVCADSGTYSLPVVAQLRDALTELLGDAQKPVTIAAIEKKFPSMFFSPRPVCPPPPAPPAYPAPTPVAPKASPKGAQQYKGNGKHDWEHTVDETFRLRVPGGWLYKTSARVNGMPSTSTTVFVPVPAAVGYAV